MGSISVFKNYKWPTNPGHYHRLVILTGDKKGTGYILSTGRAIIGRATPPNVQISVDDPKMSKEHAEIVNIQGNYYITDLGSQNGIYLNDQKTKQSAIKHEDRIVIGQTVFKFEQQYVTQINDNLPKEVIKPQEVIPEFKEHVKPVKKQNKKILIYAALLILVGGLLFMEEEPPKKDENSTEKANGPEGSTKQNVQDFVSEYKKNAASKNDEEGQKLMTVINEGLREAREKNYFRAINQFNLALIMDPNNAKASRYLDQVKNELEQNVKEIMLKAKWEFESLNYNAALIEYCSVIRIYQNQSDNEHYLNSVEEIKKILDILGKEYSENFCL